MHPLAPRPARLLAGAAAATLPLLLATACSSGSAPGSSPGHRTAHAAGASRRATASPSGSPTASRSAGPSPTGPPPLAKLPSACATLTKPTLKALVPKAAHHAAGKPTHYPDPDIRSDCAWNSMDGYQFRYLSLSLHRYTAVKGGGTAAQEAATAYAQGLGTARSAKGAKTASPPHALAAATDQAAVVTWADAASKQHYAHTTVVARTANVVVILTYEGADFAHGKAPKQSAVTGPAERALKDALAAVHTANPTASPAASASPSRTAKSSPSGA
jgi:hypothetical protein